MANPPNVIALKQTFLNAQSTLLSQPLHPSSEWTQANSSAEADQLSGVVVNDALVRVNNALTQHMKRVHPPTTTHHVAERIDLLYWGKGGDDNEGNGGADGNGEFGVGVDFATDEAISALPPEWDRDGDRERFPIEARRYGELVSQLVDLSEQRRAVRERAEKLRRMKEMLEPFNPGQGGEGDEQGDDAKNSVQENLVTRNGEIEKELERMRMLLARVAGRVGQLPLCSDGSDEIVLDDVETAEKERVEELLKMI